MTILLGAALGGCGSERTFGAEEFVQKVNDQGVEVTLGKALISEDEDKDVYAVELEPIPGLPRSGGGHTGGSLSVHEDSEGADDSLRSCQNSADLLCYRVANVVVVLEGGGIEAQRLGLAIQKLAEE